MNAWHRSRTKKVAWAEYSYIIQVSAANSATDGLLRRFFYERNINSQRKKALRIIGVDVNEDGVVVLSERILNKTWLDIAMTQGIGDGTVQSLREILDCAGIVLRER